MEENFRRVPPPPPPRPFIPRPPVSQVEQRQEKDSEFKANDNLQDQKPQSVPVEPEIQQGSINETEEVKIERGQEKQKKEINPKLKVGLLIGGSILCFVGAIVCGILLIV